MRRKLLSPELTWVIALVFKYDHYTLYVRQVVIQTFWLPREKHWILKKAQEEWLEVTENGSDKLDGKGANAWICNSWVWKASSPAFCQRKLRFGHGHRADGLAADQEDSMMAVSRKSWSMAGRMQKTEGKEKAALCGEKAWWQWRFKMYDSWAERKSK